MVSALGFSNLNMKDMYMANAIVTAEDAHRLLTYDPETGVFTWKARTGRGSNRTQLKPTAGSVSDQGYILFNVGGKLHRAHRVAWLMTHGEWPPATIDHINRVRSDNRLCNLRLATRGENQQNLSIRIDNKSGHKGVFWYEALRKWMAYINCNGQRVTLGYFQDKSEAIAARQKAERELFTHAVVA